MSEARISWLSGPVLRAVTADVFHTNEAVFVGDNPVADVAGAQGAGLQAVLRVRKPAPVMLSGLIVPDHAINSLQEMPDVLDNWFPGWRE